MCHCLECQRRTGAVISNQARFPREQVTIAGKATAWMRTAERREYKFLRTFRDFAACTTTALFAERRIFADRERLRRRVSIAPLRWYGSLLRR
jgi:hypothetical protein